MQLRKKRTWLTVLLFLSFYLSASAQLKIDEKKAIEKIKNGNTYVVVNNPNFPDADAFLDVFKKYWTISKTVQFIKAEDISKKAIPGDSFFSLMSSKQTAGSSFSPGGMGSGATLIDFYIYLWIPEKSYLKKDREPKKGDMENVALVELTGDAAIMKKAYMANYRGNKTDTLAFDGGGQILNWSAGMLKIYLQQISSAIRNGKKISYFDDITQKTELKALQTQTLYCAEANFNKVSTFTGADKTNLKELNEVFEDYKLKYETISDKDLSDKILNENKPFYFLLFTRVGSGKLITVVNSQTGETIYARYHSMSYNLKSGDLKDLYKEIK